MCPFPFFSIQHTLHIFVPFVPSQPRKVSLGVAVQIRFVELCLNIDTCLGVSVFDSSRLNLSQTMSSVFCSTFLIPSFAIFLYVSLFFTHSLFVEATCYYSDGLDAPGDVPCHKDSTVDPDFCCGQGAICLTNKICLNNIETLVRGTCTDRSWNSTACPSFCLSGDSSLEVLHTFALMTLRNHRTLWR